ncbi:hypothetical protein [Rhodococcus daqingensis]|uniref:Uncharacterized protein n=1 Tax=Rhodococcus daqingensis TaxID=2479363 RepID=A0ABW2RZ84_9NOCA
MGSSEADMAALGNVANLAGIGAGLLGGVGAIIGLGLLAATGS